MIIILCYKTKIATKAINYLSVTKSYFEIKRLQKYIDFEDILYQLKYLM